MDMTVELGREADLDELEQLYDSLNDFLAGRADGPGWRKSLYPVRETAASGIADGCLYVARLGGKIVGSVILRHKPEEAYSQVRWAFESDYSDVLVIYTLAVHPDYLSRGVGRALLDFAVGEGLRGGGQGAPPGCLREERAPPSGSMKNAGSAMSASLIWASGNTGWIGSGCMKSC